MKRSQIVQLKKEIRKLEKTMREGKTIYMPHIEAKIAYHKQELASYEKMLLEIINKLDNTDRILAIKKRFLYEEWVK